jgi:hypothetical protein
MSLTVLPDQSLASPQQRAGARRHRHQSPEKDSGTCENLWAARGSNPCTQGLKARWFNRDDLEYRPRLQGFYLPFH